jgi:hypothetical protein
MGWLLLAVFLLPAFTEPASEPLPGRDLGIDPFVLTEFQPASFDLMDFREAQRLEATSRRDAEPHTIFGLKRHLGFAGGYDNGIVHGSVGLYLTVAEWGRWNFGITSPAVGWGRYPMYDSQRKQSVTKTEGTLFVSLASVHYRLKYLPSLGVNWYITLEQIYDMRANVTGSQVGVSFSSK